MVKYFVARRLLAMVVDGIAVGVVPMIASWTWPTSARAALGAVLFVPYSVCALRWLGGTIGMLALGIRVVAEDGEKLSWARAALREVINIVFALAYVVAGWVSTGTWYLGDKGIFDSDETRPIGWILLPLLVADFGAVAYSADARRLGGILHDLLARSKIVRT
jgi:uncharacterized RDD family membrane protein YckC